MDVSRGRCLLPELRKAKGWSQADLSRKTGHGLEPDKGYSPRMISFYETFDGKGKGKPMSPEAMYTLAKVLNVNMEDLYDWVIG